MTLMQARHNCFKPAFISGVVQFIFFCLFVCCGTLILWGGDERLLHCKQGCWQEDGIGRVG